MRIKSIECTECGASMEPDYLLFRERGLEIWVCPNGHRRLDTNNYDDQELIDLGAELEEETS